MKCPECGKEMTEKEFHERQFNMILERAKTLSDSISARFICRDLKKLAGELKIKLPEDFVR